MMAKRALIVDDSKTAQFRLKKLLARYGLEIDAVNSAEEALSYLAYQAPAIVFMDHLMAGMDGFEALKIIKANPATAMIPVVMYTSKSGDLYLGQARALGAIDVLSKGVIEPSSIERVLKSVNISPVKQPVAVKASPSSQVEGEETRGTQQTKVVGVGESNGLKKVREQVANTLDNHVTKIRQDIQYNNRLMISRMMREMKNLRIEIKAAKDSHRAALPLITTDEEKEVVAETSTEENIAGEKQSRTNEKVQNNSTWMVGSLALVVLVCFYLVYLFSSVESRYQALSNDFRALVQVLDTQQMDLLSDKQILSSAVEAEAGALNSDGLLQALLWAVNQHGQYAYGEQALGDDKVPVISELVSHLQKANFRGAVVLDVYWGDFCVVPNAYGEFDLPDKGVKISDCEFISSQGEEFTIESQISLQFMNFLNSSQLVGEGKINIVMQAHGVDSPLYGYPVRDELGEASDWNRVAALNHRLNVSFITLDDSQTLSMRSGSKEF